MNREYIIDKMQALIHELESWDRNFFITLRTRRFRYADIYNVMKRYEVPFELDGLVRVLDYLDEKIKYDRTFEMIQPLITPSGLNCFNTQVLWAIDAEKEIRDNFPYAREFHLDITSGDPNLDNAVSCYVEYYLKDRIWDRYNALKIRRESPGGEALRYRATTRVYVPSEGSGTVRRPTLRLREGDPVGQIRGLKEMSEEYGI